MYLFQKQASLNAIRFIIQKDNADVSYSNCISNRNITKSFPVVNGDNIITVVPRVRCNADINQEMPYI